MMTNDTVVASDLGPWPSGVKLAMWKQVSHGNSETGINIWYSLNIGDEPDTYAGKLAMIEKKNAPP